MVVCSLESNREEGSYVCTYVVWRTDETSFLYDLVTALSVPLDVGLKLTRQDYLLDWGFSGDIERVVNLFCRRIDSTALADRYVRRRWDGLIARTATKPRTTKKFCSVD